MHPDDLQLASYLDMPPDAPEHAALRAHVLTCPACAARVARLREDARLVPQALAAGPAPDVRAAVRARLRRPRPFAWVAQAGALAGAAAVLVLLALLLGARSGATLGFAPDTLFVIDRDGRQLVALAASDGARRGALPLLDRPTALVFDGRRDLLYVRTERGVLAIDPWTLRELGRWDAPDGIGIVGGLALDERRGRLYVARRDGITALSAGETPAPVREYAAGPLPGALALAPDGSALYAMDLEDGAIWTIDLAGGLGTARLLDQSDVGRGGALAASPDGQWVYVLRLAQSGSPPAIWRFATQGERVEGPFALAAPPAPRDILLIDGERLAVARGDGQAGGVELLATDGFSATAHLDPGYDEHHLAPGPPGALFALNWLRGTVTRYDLAGQAVAWRTPRDEWSPWAAVFVRGGWRLGI